MTHTHTSTHNMYNFYVYIIYVYFLLSLLFFLHFFCSVCVSSFAAKGRRMLERRLTLCDGIAWKKDRKQYDSQR